jgi:NAD-reducing hydrogenase large subunit
MTEQSRDELRGWLPEAYETVSLAIDRLKGLLDRFSDEIEHLGSFPSLFFGMVDSNGNLEYYDGAIRIVDGEGNVVAEHLDPRVTSATSARHRSPGRSSSSRSTSQWATQPVCIASARWPDSTSRRPPGRPRADREMREFKQRSAGAVCESFHFHLARLIEMLHAVERMEQLLDEPALLGDEIRAKALLNHREGIGACEAPRGTLFHHYRVDDSGCIIDANLLIATGQNNLAMNKAVRQAVDRYVKPDAIEEGMLNRVEAAIRAFDPCLSCSTHAIGQLPLVVEVRDASGRQLHRVARGG